MSSSPGRKRRGLIGALLANVRGSVSRGGTPHHRRAKRLRLEGLEHRELLSVAPSAPLGALDGDTGSPSGVPQVEVTPIVSSSEVPVHVITQTETPVSSKADGSPCLEAVLAATNAAPEAVDDFFAMSSNQQLGAGVLTNDSDPDGDPLSVTLQSGVSHGVLDLTGSGLFTYKPDLGFAGADSFTYVANDGLADSNLATVTISVAPAKDPPHLEINQAPEAADDAYTTSEDVPLSVAAAGVLANDTDADGDDLTAILESAPSHGTLMLGLDGSLEYIPNADFFGSDQFTYVANDGLADSGLATVTITVEPVNDAPASADDAYSTSEDQTLVVDAAGVLANDADVEGDPLTAVLVDGPAQGTLSLADDGSFEYTPNADFFGSDQFTYVANDGLADSGLATVTITVEPINDAPASADDAYSTSEDQTLVVDASGVLANDADVEGDPLTAVLVEGPAQGTLTLADDGSFEYTPNADFFGSDQFTYVANDGLADSGLATVTITVEPADKLAIQLQVSGTPFGPDAGPAWAGSTFWVSAYVQDLRDIPQGVVGGAVDLLYDSLLVTPTGNVVYGDAFTAFQQGAPDNASGLIDETGALTTEGGVGASGFAPFVAWQFERAAGNGHVQFAADPGEGTATITPANFALVGSGDPVDWAKVEMGTADLDLAFADFNGDELVNHFDLALWQPHSGSAPGDPGYDPAYDLNGDSQINEQDVDLLMAAMYQPLAPAPDAGDVLTPAGLPASGDGAKDSLAGLQDACAGAWHLAGHAEHDALRHHRLRVVDRLFAGRFV